MGVVMRTIREALAWSGSRITLSLFTVIASHGVSRLSAALEKLGPKSVGVYELEDEVGVLGGRSLYEFDLVYDQLPDDLESCLRGALRKAIECGADIAWFGFEGSFDFEHLLTEDISSQVYAFADRSEVAVATDQVLETEAWTHRVAAARARLL
jgi:hypothetical protein